MVEFGKGGSFGPLARGISIDYRIMDEKVERRVCLWNDCGMLLML